MWPRPASPCAVSPPHLEVTRLRYLIRGAAALAGLYLAAVGYQLWSIQSDLSNARSALDDLSLESIHEAGGLSPGLRNVTRPIIDADRTADSPLLGLLRPLPVVGTQIDGLRDLTDTVAVLAETAESELDVIEVQLGNTGDPGGRIALVDAALDAVDTVEATIAVLPPIDDDGLLGPLGAGARELDTKLGDADEKLTELRDHLVSAREVLAGPTEVLVLAANNGEIRAGMGMHLSAGIITIEDGDITTSPFVPTSELTATVADPIEVPENLHHLYAEIWAFGREWRTTSSSPDFPLVGSVFAELSDRSILGAIGVEVDIVLSIDVPALAEILQATGPVDVDGDEVNAENVVDLLLRQIYLDAPDHRDQTERYEVQSRVATQILETITDRDIDLFDLASAIQASAARRNLLAWSGDPGVQALWASLGADGAMTSDSLLVAFQNASASKRDYFITPTVRVLPVATEEDGSRRFRFEAELTNPVLDDTEISPYFTSLSRHVSPDVHRAWVTVHLPEAARDIEVLQGRRPRIGVDGANHVAAAWLRVPEGETGSVVIEATFPADAQVVELVPSARVEPTVYEFGPDTVLDDVTQRVLLPRVATLPVTEPKPYHALALVFTFAGLVSLVARSRRIAEAGPDDQDVAAAARVDLYTAIAIFAMALVAAALAAYG